MSVKSRVTLTLPTESTTRSTPTTRTGGGRRRARSQAGPRARTSRRRPRPRPRPDSYSCPTRASRRCRRSRDVPVLSAWGERSHRRRSEGRRQPGVLQCGFPHSRQAMSFCVARGRIGRNHRKGDPMTITDTRSRWLALIVLCLGDLMIVLDTTIVNVALPSIRTDLGFSETSLAWVVNAYLLTFGGFLLLGGRLGDLFGHRRLFLMGLVLFTGASLA